MTHHISKRLYETWLHNYLKFILDRRKWTAVCLQPTTFRPYKRMMSPKIHTIFSSLVHSVSGCAKLSKPFSTSFEIFRSKFCVVSNVVKEYTPAGNSQGAFPISWKAMEQSEVKLFTKDVEFFINSIVLQCYILSSTSHLSSQYYCRTFTQLVSLQYYTELSILLNASGRTRHQKHGQEPFSNVTHLIYLFPQICQSNMMQHRNEPSAQIAEHSDLKHLTLTPERYIQK